MGADRSPATEPTPPVPDSDDSDYALETEAHFAKSQHTQLSMEELAEFGFAASTVEPKSMKDAQTGTCGMTLH